MSRVDALNFPMLTTPDIKLWTLGSWLGQANWLSLPDEQWEHNALSCWWITLKFWVGNYNICIQKYLLVTCHVLGTVVGAGDPAVSSQCPWPHATYMEVPTCKQMNKVISDDDEGYGDIFSSRLRYWRICHSKDSEWCWTWLSRPPVLIPWAYLYTHGTPGQSSGSQDTALLSLVPIQCL